MKKLIIFLLAVSVSVLFSMTAFADESLVAGDLTGDGSITFRDALMVLKSAAGLEDLSDTQKTLADVNNDSEINANDAILIFKKAAKLIWYFPGEKVEASGKIYIAGDSIASDHDVDEGYLRPLVGWGGVIGNLLGENVTVYNEARSGRSSKSYIRESNYSTYINELSKGDYFLISFGHNDEKISDASRYTDPNGSSSERESFKWYLKTYYIDPAVKVGAYPVLISSVVRCNFTGASLSKQSHEVYAIAMEELVEEYKEQGIDVGYIDLHQLTTDLYNQIGQEEAETMHAYTDSALDRTHYCSKGAQIISEMIVASMREQEYDICRFFKN